MDKKNTILYIVAGSPQTGLGHLIRAHYLALELNKYFQQSILLTEATIKPASIAFNAFTYWITLPNFDNKSKIEYIINQIQLFKPSICILDHYDISDSYNERLFTLSTGWVHFISPSDQVFSADILISSNPSISLDSFKINTNSNQKCLLGTKYAIIRSSYNHNYCPPKKKNKSILISMGGGNDQGLTEKLIKYLCQAFTQLDITAIVGPSNPNIEQIRELEACYKETLTIKVNPPDIFPIFRNSSVAIISGGTTFFELAACRIPVIAVPFTENQSCQVESLKTLEALIMVDYTHMWLDNLSGEINKILHNFNYRTNLIDKAYSLVNFDAASDISGQIIRHFFS